MISHDLNQGGECARCGVKFPSGRAAKAVSCVSLAHDPVNHPAHYTGHPSGIECIVITEHMNFCRGNAVKYIWRADDKGDAIENLKKARWYLDREIARLEKAKG